MSCPNFVLGVSSSSAELHTSCCALCLTPLDAVFQSGSPQVTSDMEKVRRVQWQTARVTRTHLLTKRQCKEARLLYSGKEKARMQ